MAGKPKNRKTKKPKNNPFLSFSVFKFFGSHAGFTLIEILVVATIVSILAAGLGSSFFAGMRLWGRAQQRDTASLNAWFALEVMARELRQSMEVPFAKFEGGARELSFPAAINDAIVRVTYVYDGYEKRLRRLEVGLSDLLEEKLEPEVKERVLFWPAEDVAIEFATFDPIRDENGAVKGYAWTDAWEEDDGLPVAIRLTIKTRHATLTKTILLPIA